MIPTPFYQFRCEDHGDTDEYRSMRDAIVPCDCWCGKTMVRVFVMPHISAELTPAKRPETVAANARERLWAVDRDAYKRIRQDGIQPRSVLGAAELEKHAETKTEIEMGKIMPSRWVKEGVDMSQDLVGKDLEP